MTTMNKLDHLRSNGQLCDGWSNALDAIMVFPEDAEAREYFRVAQWADELQARGDDLPNDMIVTLAHGPGREAFQKRGLAAASAGHRAGVVLRVALAAGRARPQYASKRRAVAMAAKVEGVSVDTVSRAWDSHHSVAHLWAAATAAYDDGIRDRLVQQFSALAFGKHYLRQASEHHIPIGSTGSKQKKAPLLLPEQAWWFSDDRWIDDLPADPLDALETERFDQLIKQTPAKRRSPKK